MSNHSKQPDLYAYMATGTDEKPFFTKIGAALKNKKGGYGLRLEAFPTSGDIVLFPPREKSDNAAADK